jgi:hypothetical protein
VDRDLRQAVDGVDRGSRQPVYGRGPRPEASCRRPWTDTRGNLSRPWTEGRNTSTATVKISQFGRLVDFCLGAAANDLANRLQRRLRRRVEP